MTQITQRNQTRNQSTADFQVNRVFIFDNRFEYGAFKNTTGASFTLLEGMLVARSLTIVGGLIPVTFTDLSTNNLADCIGIASQEGSVVLAANAISNISYCTKGTVNSNLLQLPAGVTLDTVVGNKVLRDVLEALGLHIDSSTVENTKFDN